MLLFVLVIECLLDCSKCMEFSFDTCCTSKMNNIPHWFECIFLRLCTGTTKYSNYNRLNRLLKQNEVCDRDSDSVINSEGVTRLFPQSNTIRRFFDKLCTCRPHISNVNYRNCFTMFHNLFCLQRASSIPIKLVKEHAVQKIHWCKINAKYWYMCMLWKKVYFQIYIPDKYFVGPRMRHDASGPAQP